VIQEQLTLSTVLLCTAVSLLFGFGAAAVYMVNHKHNKGFVSTLVILPAIVQIIIMLVNGNIGVGIAVAGAFSLVRFRSIPGNSRDIACIFFAMAIGFVNGMGYLFYGAVFLVIIGGVTLWLSFSSFGNEKQDKRILKITIPENLDYEEVFDDLFTEYTSSAELDRIKTTNMGSLFELRYEIRLKNPLNSKAFIDALRCRNGNLNISLGRERMADNEL
jgi:hypothetical protein